jgi:hypothetical protein
VSESKKSIYLVGYSGHAFVVIEAINKKKYKIEGYFDLQEVAQNPYKISYFGTEDSDLFSILIQKRLPKQISSHPVLLYLKQRF